jgi:hypothetical protein
MPTQTADTVSKANTAIPPTDDEMSYCQLLCSEKVFKRRIPAGFRL